MSLLFSNWRPVISGRPPVKIKLKICGGGVRTSSHDWCDLKSLGCWGVRVEGGRGFINGKIEVVWLADRGVGKNRPTRFRRVNGPRPDSQPRIRPLPAR